MPYTVDDSGFPSKIGIISEVLDQRPGGMAKTLITGSQEDKDKNIFQTAVRELKEETNVDVSAIKNQLKLIGMHPISTIRKGFGVTYGCILPPNYPHTLKPQDGEISEVKWHNANEIPHDQMAFDHGDIIQQLINRFKRD
jgi:8-oxo-dGTP pyrophosphatase MutT (NUDIX family)